MIGGRQAHPRATAHRQRRSALLLLTLLVTALLTLSTVWLSARPAEASTSVTAAESTATRPARPAPAAPAAPAATPSSSPAAPSAPSSASTGGGNTSSSGPLAPLDAADTHGLSIGKYQLSVDTGGVTNGIKLITNGVLLSGLWEAYRWSVGAAVAMIDLALQMEWVDWLVEAINPVASTLQNDVVAQLGLRALALGVMGVWVAVLIAGGRIGKGLSQLLVSSAVAALAAGALANPVAVVTGQDGVLYVSRDAGQAVATVIASDGRSNTPDPDMIQEKTGGALVDTFVRLPHQLINYGRILDGSSCQGAYDDALAGGPYESDDDSARAALGGCEQKLKDYADDPGWTGVASVAILAPAGGALALLAIVLVVIFFLATLMVIFFAVKLIIDVILAIMPGERSGLWSSVAGLLGSVLTVAGLIAMLALYCVFLRGVLTTKSNTDMLVRFFIVDAMVVSFIVVTVLARQRISERARKMAEKAASLSGGGRAQPAQMPKLSQARAAITQAASTRAAVGRVAGTSTGASTTAMAGAARTAASGNAAQRVLHRVASNRVVKAGVTAASLAGGAAGLAAKATIGAPVYGPRAARVVGAAARSRAAAARASVQRTSARGKAFAGEYRDGLAMAARPALAVGKVAARPAAAAGKAAGRAAAPAVTAASIRLSNPKQDAQTPPRPAGISTSRSRAGQPTPRTVTAARERQRMRREAARSTAVPTPARTSSTPGATSKAGAKLGAVVERRFRFGPRKSA
ncbi:hypothetical protein [Kineococcus gypseus]|uniref:hypothetical protein n=1 Tax=Kineococcus gypseus TaxID=1637102 RepID=UPI003D7F128D